jgi:hypothetical protein
LAWIRIQKTILKGRKPIATQVINTKNLENILKSYMGYREFSKIRISLDYLDQLQMNEFAIIRQLGPPTFLLLLLQG